MHWRLRCACSEWPGPGLRGGRVGPAAVGRGLFWKSGAERVRAWPALDSGPCFAPAAQRFPPTGRRGEVGTGRGLEARKPGFPASGGPPPPPQTTTDADVPCERGAVSVPTRGASRLCPAGREEMPPRHILPGGRAVLIITRLVGAALRAGRPRRPRPGFGVLTSRLRERGSTSGGLGPRDHRPQRSHL